MPALFSRRLHRSDYLLTAAYWSLAVLVILPTYVREDGWARALGAMFYNVVLDTGTVLALVFGLLPRFMQRGRLGSSLLLALAAAGLSGVLYLVGYDVVLGKYHGAWSLTYLIGGIIAHARSYGILAVLLIGKRYFEGQQHLLLAQKAQAESELKSLRAQVDPHFLFNNLNILYALIQQNQEEASHFLSCFSSLYRYLIRHKDADLVPLEEELRFANEYIYLLGHRFGTAYQFERTSLPAPAELAGLFVVPGTLQVLLENVVKHNRGDEDNPLLVTLAVRPDALVVRHRRAPKRTAVESMGTGLSNLRERYRLLAGREPEVQADEFFTVTVPVLKM
ncbi:sensor histidine kinase [Hymenobacter bucti]|uniref:Sensor histidine kinase n=1 Tax=Hymenobacter bucti TaxID=1844114 RepID=A0ABW4QPI6_9BACT